MSINMVQYQGMTAMTKGDAATYTYGGETFDYALPQPWVDAMTKIFPYVPIAGHFIWLYPEGNLMGMPMPITRQGVEMLAELSLRI